MQHHRAVGKHLIWCETELINWVCAGAGSWYYQAKRGLIKYRTRRNDNLHSKMTNDVPESSVLCEVLTVSHISVLSTVWESGIVQHDVISEMCASTVIFRWKLNCKRQTWISLCLSLSSWQEQSQKFGWSSSWPRCSVQISATRWRWRPLHRLDGYCKPRRVFYSEGRSCGTTRCEAFPFHAPLMTAQSKGETGQQIQPPCLVCDVLSLMIKMNRFWVNWCLKTKTWKHLESTWWQQESSKVPVWIMWIVLKPTVAYQQLLWSDGVICVDAKLLCG